MSGNLYCNIAQQVLHRTVSKWTMTYVLEYICTEIWIFIFMGFALTGWFIWFFLLCWLLVQAKLLYSTNDEFSDLGNPTLTWTKARFTIVLSAFTLYTWFWRRDQGIEECGSHPRKFMRKLGLWKLLRDYFPINLILCDDIVARQDLTGTDKSTSQGVQKITCNPSLFPISKNYLVGYHPHGIFGVGAFVNFATESNGFSEKFPGLTPWLTTLEVNFKAPFQRDFLLSFRITYLLDPQRCGKTGNFVIVVIGGAPEALDSRPGKSTLVPCISFGEPNMYQQIKNPPGGRLRQFQDRFTEIATFSPPIFYAHAWMPYRTPVNTVVGPPIPVPKVEQPSREQVAELKDLYLDRLNQLFQRYKPIYDPQACDLEFF
ncbi:2-acylglycerol O-acyltransferase 2 [Paragonimus westermani]|uniref:Acyltransferase n=1 Tax=Paragonimus westermani TaxID=34504 RepID=A0A5J4NDH9_9TREM|nr:2-acylglycerol O-acyltransferase 2 [Paragonimus westermani]